MKEDLKYILKDKKLLLKKNMFIPNGVKEILLLQLEKLRINMYCQNYCIILYRKIICFQILMQND